MQAGNWAKIGGQNTWGSFDFITTDPTRSNSGQLTLSLWAQSKTNNLNDPAINELFSTVKKSVYLPPRSTDILLQEFIARGPNDADVATVYESIALSRWQESQTSKGQPYQIYYLNPTIETTATAVIVGKEEAATAKKFLAFLREPESQKIFIKHGFRPVIKGVDIQSVSDSPWQKNIPGAEVNPRSQISPAPDSQTLGEIKRLWERQ
jgi:ABC-type sulfate transport system substrate-binding protein